MNFASHDFWPESKQRYHSMKSGDRQQEAWERREGETERGRNKERERERFRIVVPFKGKLSLETSFVQLGSSHLRPISIYSIDQLISKCHHHIGTFNA